MEPTSTESQKCNEVLIIEDDRDVREALRVMLETEGYRVSEAENGKIGLDVLKTIQRPCLILLDLMMPVMDGWKFAEAIEHDVEFGQIPIVVVTAFADKADTLKVRSVLKKPIDIEVLLKTVNKFCH